jgi:hypothetical protein
MSVKVKRSEKATFNYTNRTKIHQKDCLVSIVDRESGQLKIRVVLDPKNIPVKEGQVLVLEVFYALLYARFDLDTGKPVKTIALDSSFPASANPRFRLKLISKDDAQGKVLSATTFFSASESEGAENGKNTFLKFQYADLNGLIWRIDWSNPENPTVQIDTKFSKRYKVEKDQMAQAFMYPYIVKEIVSGIMWRNPNYEDLDERLSASKWFKFCEQKLGMAIPEEDEWDDKEAIIAFAESAAQKFATQKWDGKKTILEQFLASQ